MSTSSDEAVRGTNTSATECKACAVNLGYYQDPFIHHFVSSKGERRQPEINRGNFIRVRLVRQLIEQFIDKCNTRQLQYQIVNIGCGSDTLFWRLRDAGYEISAFVETDFPDVTSKKAFVVNKVPALKKAAVGSRESLLVANKGTDIHGSNYHLVGGDLRKWNELEPKLIDDCGLDFNLPTLILTECVLVYLPPEKTTNLLSWFTSKFTSSFVVNYEQVNLHTRFAQVMIESLRHHNCDLLGKDACYSLDTQKQRFVDCGFSAAGAVNVWDAYENLPYETRVKIEKIEFLDEFEVMKQLLEHYCVAWAWKDGSELGLAQIVSE